MEASAELVGVCLKTSFFMCHKILNNIVFPEAENGRLKEIHILLRQCGEVELAVLLDVAGSLLRNRGSVK